MVSCPRQREIVIPSFKFFENVFLDCLSKSSANTSKLKNENDNLNNALKDENRGNSFFSYHKIKRSTHRFSNISNKKLLWKFVFNINKSCSTNHQTFLLVFVFFAFFVFSQNKYSQFFLSYSHKSFHKS